MSLHVRMQRAEERQRRNETVSVSLSASRWQEMIEKKNVVWIGKSAVWHWTQRSVHEKKKKWRRIWVNYLWIRRIRSEKMCLPEVSRRQVRLRNEKQLQRCRCRWRSRRISHRCSRMTFGRSIRSRRFIYPGSRILIRRRRNRSEKRRSRRLRCRIQPA